MADLKARSRWCLTGTPIQNRLEDIGCLFSFLGISPFNNLSVFRKHIVQSFEQGDRAIAIAGFTQLLDSMCLRRTSEGEHIVLDRQDTIRMVDLSSQERRQYDDTKAIMMQAVRNQVGEQESHSALSLFQVILQLRVLCNHGTWQQPFSWTRRNLNSLDEVEASIELTLGAGSEVTCTLCMSRFPTSGCTSMYRRYTQICRHILCTRCIEQTVQTDYELPSTVCPLCAPTVVHDLQLFHTGEHNTYFQGHGCSAKMKALMDDVLPHIWTTKR